MTVERKRSQHSLKDEGYSWKPTATLDTLRQRAQLMQRIRDFFYRRNILEVETPILGESTTTDLHIHSLLTDCLIPGQAQWQPRFLQTSPEFPMKRLLAAGSGPIFQISKAFRQDAFGQWHNPEFTLLEWYRPGMDDQQLMDEVDALLQTILHTSMATRVTYQQLFLSQLAICPFTTGVDELSSVANQQAIQVDLPVTEAMRDTWLQLLMSYCIEPTLGQEQPVFVYDYPLSQGGFAKQNSDNTAARFEVYVQGVELANGYHEINDANEQRQRFIAGNQQRMQAGDATVPLDEHVLAALQHGLPDCAGVALGIDRLIMLALGKTAIQDVIAFPITNA